MAYVFRCASSRAMGPDGGAVDRHERSEARGLRQERRKSSATARVCSSDCTVENRWPILVRKRPPAAALAKRWTMPLMTRRSALRSGPVWSYRKMRLDRRPLPLVQPEIVRHDLSRLGNQFNWVQTLAASCKA